MDNLNHPTGFTYSLDVVEDYPGYEWKPELDERGRTIFKPHKIIKIQDETTENIKSVCRDRRES